MNERETLDARSSLLGIGLMAFVMHSMAIWCGVYFHYVSLGSTLTPLLRSLAHAYGGFGFWLPAFGFAIPISIVYVFAGYIAFRKAPSRRPKKIESIAGLVIGGTSVFAFALVGLFATTG